MRMGVLYQRAEIYHMSSRKAARQVSVMFTTGRPRPVRVHF